MLVLLVAAGCGQNPPPINNPCESDPAGCQPVYIGSATCVACHANFSAWHSLHGHSQALKLIEGEAPQYPGSSGAPGVPNPPAGLAWTDLRLVVGGYTKYANFVGSQGFLLTDGAGGPLVQYTLPFLVSLAPGGFVPLTASAAATTPYDFECFRCHTTGPQSLAANGGLHQENRPGLQGTWALEGVQCEACHGPGSVHIQNPSADNIQIDSSQAACGRCHGNPVDPQQLPAANGFVVGTLQWAEVLASPHADFACTVCHEPHASVIYDRDNGVRNACQNCHPTANMARHENKVLAQGDYAEFLSCRSCHMPPAGRNGSSTIIGQARIGDTRTHIINIDIMNHDFRAMLTADGQQVARDANGKAAVTVDMVCLRCHNGGGSAFALDLRAAAAIAEGIHNPP